MLTEPKLPVSEAVAPRCTWEKGTTAQSPFRCSDVLPRIPCRIVFPRIPCRETASLDPTRVPTQGESNTVRVALHILICEVAQCAWRKTKPTTPLGVGSPSDPCIYCYSHLDSSSGARRLLGTRATEEQLGMITAKHTRCDVMKCPLTE